MRTFITSFFFALLLLPAFLMAVPAGGQPEELGAVKWGRSLASGQIAAKKNGKPILILFQEVPGCGTCKNYGNKVLTHPLIVEAIETEFEPVAIYNNNGGADAATLREFGEPSWNNPVVRVVDVDKKDLTARVSGNYSQLGLVTAMVEALRAKGRKVPGYLDLLLQELEAGHSGTQTAIFGMYCFWSGEKKLGQLEGVVATEPGFVKGSEVVKVAYNPAVISREKLVEQAKKAGCASKIYQAEAGKFRPDQAPKYYLGKTLYRHVPMTPLQASRANSLIAAGKSPAAVLSPFQQQLAARVRTEADKKWPVVISVEIGKAWQMVAAVH